MSMIGSNKVNDGEDAQFEVKNLENQGLQISYFKI